MKKSMILFVLLISVAALALSACSTQATPVYAQGDEKDKAISTADPMAQDILDGIQQDDFTLYSKDFDDQMAKASTKDSFETMIKQFSAYGELQGSEPINVEIVSTYYRVNYKLTFANKVLTMGVVIPNDGTSAVSGLWFK
jgi:ABC-type glycerol-3-phosphate transport system substrate-binding protein